MPGSNLRNVQVPVDDPEKVSDLRRNVTSSNGEVHDVSLKHAIPNDGDEALLAFVGHEGETIVMTPEMERKLLRKIDLNLMPILCVVYGLNYLDKTSVGTGLSRREPVSRRRVTDRATPRATNCGAFP